MKKKGAINGPVKSTCISFPTDDDQLNQFAPNAERRIRERILFERNYSARERPVLNSADTLNVTIGIFLHAMLHLVRLFPLNIVLSSCNLACTIFSK